MNLLSGRNSASNDSDLWSDAMDRLNFQKRTCTTFIPKETNKESCVCNYYHSESEPSSFIKTWDLESHTRKEDTKSYGILPQLKRPYLRCDIKTELDQLCLVLLGVWDTPVPGLIMRMMSDVDSTPNIKIQKEFLQAISDAAVASDAWIITSGYKEESISELIGEIVYKSQIKNPEINFSAIAVGKWGNIHDCHKLEDRSSVSQYSPHKGGHGRYKLESNHTHYIFFDDGTCDSLDTGEFASNLAREISRGARRKIPLITILVGGTLHAISSIFTDLQKQIPIVIVEGSGQLADILCFYKSSEIENQVTNDQDEAYSDHEDDADITMVDEKFSQDDAKNPPSPTQNTLRTAWRLLGKNRLEFANDVRKLYTLRWSIADASENQLVTTTRIWNDTTKIAQNRLLLIDALSKNLLVFVGNFVKLDIDITVLFGPASGSSTAVNNSWSRKHQKKSHREPSRCFKMIPIDDTVDYAWSEFERYSTNDYIRQLLDVQATDLANAMNIDIT
ncbi:unnamed protein product [Rotaria sordida]|uniref:TRPM SLOG domain-containing protein n=1 Tax=Rotaria sordida TaxID=392033 RepID=A0A814CCH9_9BILA|nr:unnamed protein product [Rotaria sordida]CAF1024577.1 unnamed protein product [Rotaria sordida]